MKSFLLAATVALLSACAPRGAIPPQAGGTASPLPGFMVEVEGVEIWMDTTPTTSFSTIARNVALPLDQDTWVFPADRLAAIAAAVRERGGSGAIVRTLEQAAPERPFGKYRYEVDVIR